MNYPNEINFKYFLEIATWWLIEWWFLENYSVINGSIEQIKTTSR